MPLTDQLLKLLPNPQYEDGATDYPVGWNDCLSEIKSILIEVNYD